MQGIGLIVEYNPFHNGHRYHLEKAKEKYPNGVIIAVMSGDFVQRGEVSILNRYEKTKLAIENGVDVVIELPSFYSSQSAEIFAKGAVGILDMMRCNRIFFGSETGDIDKLIKISSYQESLEFQEFLKTKLDEGYSYPTAHSLTMENILKEEKLNSNDILGLEYLKAVKYWQSDIKCEVLKREKVGYYDSKIVENFASATEIRKKLKNFGIIENVVPKNTKILCENKKNLVSLEEFYPLIRYEIINNLHNLHRIQDMETGFEMKLYKNAIAHSNYKDFFENILTKRYTIGRVQRILIHILLGITKEITQKVKKEIPYIRVLGFSDKGKEYLKYLKQFENPKIITTYKKMQQNLSKYSCDMIEFNEKNSNIYKIIDNYIEQKIPYFLKKENNLYE